MRLLTSASAILAVAGFALVAGPASSPAAAFTAGGSKSLASQTASQNLVVEVQRRGRRGVRRHGRNAGAAAAAGIIGGIAAGIIASEAARAREAEEDAFYEDYDEPLSPAEAYCARRFRSWDRDSQSYMGFDGRRHPCP